MKNLCQIHFTLLPVSVRTTNHPPANGQVERLSVTITKRSCRAVTARESTGNFPKPSPLHRRNDFSRLSIVADPLPLGREIKAV